MGKRTWVQDPETGKLVPKEEWHGQRDGGAAILGDIEPFVSPVDGRTISSRSHLRDHNRRHGVTDSRDYSQKFMLDRSEKRIAEMTGQTKAAKAERRGLIMREMAKYD